MGSKLARLGGLFVAAGTGWHRADLLQNGNCRVLLMLAISVGTSCNVPQCKRSCDWQMLAWWMPTSLYSGHKEVGWGRLANERCIFSYECCLASACDGAQAATLSGMMCKYHLFLLCCGDCLFSTAGGSHTALKTGSVPLKLGCLGSLVLNSNFLASVSFPYRLCSI
jgi:hypothetical protein